VIQLPTPRDVEAFSAKNQRLPTARPAAHGRCRCDGVAVCASASLLQAAYARDARDSSEAFPGLDSDAQRSLQFVRSTPAQCRAGRDELGAHVTHNLATADARPLR